MRREVKGMYTLTEWVQEWLYTYKRVLIKPSTFDSYVTYATHIQCDTALDELTSLDIQRLINAMVREHKAYSTIKHMLTLCRQSLRKARSLGLIDSLSCMDELELPRSYSKPIESLCAADGGKILMHTDASFYGDFFAALLLTGCRVGELIALRWCDVDFFSGSIYIEHTDYKGELQPVKTQSGARQLPMTDQLRRILEQRFRAEKRERVFTSTRGTPIRYRTLLDSWHWYTRKLGIAQCGLHVLRHTFAHRALRAGVPVKVVSSWLGHASVMITLSIYDHVTRDDMHTAAETLTAAFEHTKRA